MSETDTESGTDDGSGATERARAAEQPRATTARAWEVLVREGEDDPLRHVGSVTAPTADAAHEQAARLFDRFARDLWLCPADEVRRYSTGSLADEGSTPTERR